MKQKNYDIDDMRRAFGYFAFKSISNQPYNDRELKRLFRKFIHQLDSDKRLAKNGRFYE